MDVLRHRQIRVLSAPSLEETQFQDFPDPIPSKSTPQTGRRGQRTQNFYENSFQTFKRESGALECALLRRKVSLNDHFPGAAEGSVNILHPHELQVLMQN